MLPQAPGVLGAAIAELSLAVAVARIPQEVIQGIPAMFTCFDVGLNFHRYILHSNSGGSPHTWGTVLFLGSSIPRDGGQHRSRLSKKQHSRHRRKPPWLPVGQATIDSLRRLTVNRRLRHLGLAEVPHCGDHRTLACPKAALQFHILPPFSRIFGDHR